MPTGYTDEHAERGIDVEMPIIDSWPNQFPGYRNVIVVNEFTSVCLSGTTFVDVATDEEANPRGVMIKDLVGKEGIVFSFDLDAFLPVAKRFHSVRCTNRNANLVSVDFVLFRDSRLRENHSVCCTEDHPFLARTGWYKYSWVKAKDLREGMQLVSNQRASGSIRSMPRHRLVVECLLGRSLFSHELVHHSNGRHFDNTPTNLVVSNGSSHISYHQRKRYGYDSLDIDELVRQYLEGFSMPELAKRFGCDIDTVWNRLRGRVSSRTHSEALLVRPEHKVLFGLQLEAGAFYKQGYTQEELALYYGVSSSTIGVWVKKTGVGSRTSLQTKQLRKSVVSLPALNHRVIGVKCCGRGPVYNMDVEDTSCFFANDVVVHNCPKTGLPDFGVITIIYEADRLCFELKSLKEYFLAYRTMGIFYENAINKIARDLVAAVSPKYLHLHGKFSSRGGIYSICEVCWTPEQQFFSPVRGFVDATGSHIDSPFV